MGFVLRKVNACAKAERLLSFALTGGPFTGQRAHALTILAALMGLADFPARSTVELGFTQQGAVAIAVHFSWSANSRADPAFAFFPDGARMPALAAVLSIRPEISAGKERT